MSNALKYERDSFIGNFKIGESLGSGAASVVYRAEKQGKYYALKVMKSDGQMSPLDLELRLRTEGAILSRLNHPGIVKVEEVGRDGEHAFIAMELVNGVTLKQYAATLMRQPEKIPVVISRIASALSEVHRLGLIHRDIKPENILILPDSLNIKLIDFGFVMRDAEQSAAETIVGTLQYCSPEQIGVLNRVMDARSDLYSLGVVLYWLLLGNLPFESNSVNDLIKAHSSIIPPEPSKVRADINASLSQLTMKLLRKDPDDRYQTAMGLVWDLDNVDKLKDKNGAYVLDRTSPRGIRRNLIPLVGREQEMGSIERCLESAFNAKGSFLLIEGPSGSGKTRLVEEVLSGSLCENKLVLEGKAQISDLDPFSPIREAFDKIISDRVRDEAFRSMLVTAAGDSAFLLKKLSRGLAEIFKDAPVGAELSPEIERQRYQDAITRFLLSLGEMVGGLIVHIGDIQWLDQNSRMLLGKLSSQIKSSKVIVLMTGRNDSESIDATNNLCATLAPESLERIVLGPLTRGDVGSLVFSYLGNKHLNSKYMDRIYNISDGNPFAVLECLQGMIEKGVLYTQGHEWCILEEEFGKMNVSKTLVQLVVDRLSKLKQSHREILEFAAVEGTYFESESLVYALGSDSALVYRALEEAIFLGFISKARNGGFQFVHDSIRESLLSGIDEQKVQFLNQKIADFKYEHSNRTPEAYYKMSKYFVNGLPEQHTERFFEVTLAASRYALDMYFNSEAYNLLQTIIGSTKSSAGRGKKLEILELAGIAAARNGKFDEALAHIEAALPLASSRLERARILYLKARTQSASGQIMKSWDTIELGLSSLGRAIPNLTMVQIVSLIWTGIWASFLSKTNLGFGRAHGKERARRKLISQFYQLGQTPTYFRGHVVRMIYLIFKDLANAHFLGACYENVIAHSFYAFVMGLFVRKKAANFYSQRAITIAETIKDKYAITGAHLYDTFITEFLGDVHAADERFSQIIPDVKRYLGSREKSECLTAHMFQNVTLGRSLRAIDYYYKNIKLVDEWDNQVMRSNFRICAYSELAHLGRHEEALQVRDEILAISSKSPEIKFCMCYVYSSHIQVLLDRDDLGAEMEENIKAFLDLKFQEYWNRYAFALIAYVRLRQMQLASGREKAKKLKELKKASMMLSFNALTPLHQCHLHIIKGYICAEAGKYAKAKQCIGRGLDLALQMQNSWGAYEANLALARVQDDGKLKIHYAQNALQVALREGWQNRSKRIQKEFGIAATAVERSASSGLSSAVNIGKAKAENRASVLLNVSLALSNRIDFAEQTQIALDEVRRILAAERAYLFIKKGDELSLLRGRDSNGDLSDYSTISMTTVRQCYENQKPVILSGAKDAEVLGAKSAILHNLRSVMVVPMTVKNVKLGVLYLDSSLAKGIFSEDDVDLLVAVSTQIAISLQNTKLAQIEMERREMEKEMELTSAVQKMFLPESTQVQIPGISLTGFYRPAVRCGGDWWWYRVKNEKTISGFVGDVTGHGANAAMITATVASCFKAFEKDHPDSELPKLVQMTNDVLYEIVAGEYYMPSLAFEVDSRSRVIKFWSAAAPVIFITRNGQKAERLSGEAATPVGMGKALEMSEFSAQLQPGDRVYMTTDGITEMNLPDGRPYGERRFAKLLESMSQIEFTKVVPNLIDEIDKLRSNGPQEDDYTLVVLEVA